MEKQTVGMVGLGQMGGPIAGHIAKAGYRLFVHDLDETRLRTAEKAGARISPSLTDLGRAADLIIVMVGYDDEVLKICCGDAGLVNTMRPGSSIVIMSTITVQTMTKIVEVAKTKAIHIIDAPVTRAEEGAIAGNLLLLGGADKEAFERARPVFSTFCADIFLFGPPGCGQVAKICNNILLWISVVGNYETINLAETYGLDKAELTKALMISTGTNGTLHRWEKMTMPWVHKDLTIALDFAETLNVGLPMAGLTKQLFKVFDLPKVKPEHANAGRRP